MNRFLSTLFITLLLANVSLASLFEVHASERISEPPLSESVSWDLSPTGMLEVGYDMDGNGKVDLYTFRVVDRSYFSRRSTAEMAEYYPDHRIFSVDYENSHYHYIAGMDPVLYAVDQDEDGQWDRVYKDVLADGVNGNEYFHDLPFEIKQEPAVVARLPEK